MIDVEVPALLTELGIVYERRGYELWAPCPLPDHDEQDPSWHIEDRLGSEKHAFHRCFGCKQGGGAIGLVRQMLELEGEDAGKQAYQWMREHGLVGDRVGTLPHRVRLVRTERKVGECLIPRGVVLDVPLEDWPTPMRKYAIGRGLTAEQVESWGVGYAVHGRMRGRIVFVARDQAGKVLRYNGRKMSRQRAKYLGPRRGQWWDKSAVFGEQHWPAQRDVVVVAEGEINALACERAAADVLPTTSTGIAALAGSELLIGQVNKLSTFTHLLVVSDPDQAGDRLWETIWQSLARWAVLSRAMITEKDGDAAKMPMSKLVEALREAWCTDISR